MLIYCNFVQSLGCNLDKVSTPTAFAQFSKTGRRKKKKPFFFCGNTCGASSDCDPTDHSVTVPIFSITVHDLNVIVDMVTFKLFKLHFWEKAPVSTLCHNSRR